MMHIENQPIRFRNDTRLLFCPLKPANQVRDSISEEVDATNILLPGAS